MSSSKGFEGTAEKGWTQVTTPSPKSNFNVKTVDVSDPSTIETQNKFASLPDDEAPAPVEKAAESAFSNKNPFDGLADA